MRKVVCPECKQINTTTDTSTSVICKCRNKFCVSESVVVTDNRYASSNVVRPNAWVTIHSRYAAAMESGQWSETVERHWLDNEFSKLVPCGSCGSKWLDIKPTIDLSTAEDAFRTTWHAHNTVSAEHVQPAKPPITYDQCRALYLQQPSMDDCCIAVTSLAPDQLERQTLCLNTWKRAGLTIFAVQSVAETAILKPQFPQVSTWCIQNESGPPPINRMAAIAATIQQTILLINSDIEIRGEQRLIREAIQSGTLIGIRHNYHSQWWINNREQWGIDAFSIQPSDRLPELPFRIGRPVWDYWLLHHFRESQSWISEPLFFHRTHKQRWSKSDWDAGAKVFTDHYGLEDFDSMKFRRQFPFAG